MPAWRYSPSTMRVINGVRPRRRLRPKNQATQPVNTTGGAASTSVAYGECHNALRPSKVSTASAQAQARRATIGSISTISTSKPPAMTASSGRWLALAQCASGEYAIASSTPSPSTHGAHRQARRSQPQTVLLASTCADNARSDAKMRRFSSLSERSWKP